LRKLKNTGKSPIRTFNRPNCLKININYVYGPYEILLIL